MFTSQNVYYRKREDKEMQITIKMKSKDEGISKPVTNQDLAYKCLTCPQFSGLHLWGKRGRLILTGFSGCRGQRTLVPGCVRDDSLRDACEPGKSFSDVSREPKWEKLGSAPPPRPLTQRLGIWEGGWGDNHHLLISPMCSLLHAYFHLTRTITLSGA